MFSKVESKLSMDIQDFAKAQSSEAGLYQEFVNNSYSFCPHPFFASTEISIALLSPVSPSLFIYLCACVLSLSLSPPWPSPFLSPSCTLMSIFFFLPLSKPQHIKKPEPDFKKFVLPIQYDLQTIRSYL